MTILIWALLAIAYFLIYLSWKKDSPSYAWVAIIIIIGAFILTTIYLPPPYWINPE